MNQSSYVTEGTFQQAQLSLALAHSQNEYDL